MGRRLQWVWEYGSESERILLLWAAQGRKDGSVAEGPVLQSRMAFIGTILGLYSTSDGSENNIILSNKAPFSHNFSPFLDRNLQGFPSKALAGIASSGLMALGPGRTGMGSLE